MCHHVINLLRRLFALKFDTPRNCITTFMVGFNVLLSRLKALKRMGIVNNYEDIRNKTVAVVGVGGVGSGKNIFSQMRNG